MKLIKPSFSILPQSDGLEGIYRQIEMAGRTCYKSEDKITETSAKEFVDRMIKSGHGAMLEHGTIYMLVPFETHSGKYRRNKYSKVCDIAKSEMGDRSAVTTNLRVLVEKNWLDDLQYICEPTEYHERRYTVKFICDRGVSHEFVRHRVFSFAQESTRYCNYSKDKFGNEVTFIIPEWFDLKEGHCTYKDALVENGTLKEQGGFYIDDLYIGNEWGGEIWSFLWTLQHCEHYYFGLINKGWKPQQARAILPNSLKTELVMTGFVSDWKHFFELRCAGAAHPQARELAIPLREEFINKGYI